MAEEHSVQNMALLKSDVKKYVLAVDVGSTNIKGMVMDKRGVVLGQCRAAVKELTPLPGCYEYDPEQLWSSFLDVCKGAIEDANLRISDISCLGLSMQRSSILTWSRSTGKPLHQIISWKDQRAKEVQRMKNSSILIKVLRILGRIGFALSGNKTLELAKSISFSTIYGAIRLCWAFQNIGALREATMKGDAMFGTLDTWLLYKLTDGRLHATVPDHIVTTGLWNMIDRSYDSFMMWYFGIPDPSNFLPLVMENGTRKNAFGSTSSNAFFGANIPISAVMSDSLSSCYAHGLDSLGSVKVSLGTGAFLSCNTGNEPLFKFEGLLPIVGWTTENDNCKYFAEGFAGNTNAALQLLTSTGFCNSLDETSDIASRRNSNTGPICISSYALDDEKSAAIIGLRPNHDRGDVIKAVLESVAFEVKYMVDLAMDQLPYFKDTKTIRVDGGGASNDFMLQTIANLTGKTVLRSMTSEMPCVGAALMAGLYGGVWDSEMEMRSINWDKDCFTPKFGSNPD